MTAMKGTVRVGYLHHSTGEIVWGGGIPGRARKVLDRLPDAVTDLASAVWSGGVPGFVRRWNASHATDYRISEVTYPDTSGGYPWANYPYDYWNLWVAHTGPNRDRGELNLDDLAQRYDVIVFKHCYPVSRIEEDEGPPDVSSEKKTLANYKLQYDALKARLHQFPGKRFVVWTGPVLARSTTTASEARRAREFFDWVRNTWDEKGDNVFLWDFYSLEADGDGYLASAYAKSPADSHPNRALARFAAPLIGRRIVDVIEGRGDAGSVTGLLTSSPQEAVAR